MNPMAELDRLIAEGRGDEPRGALIPGPLRPPLGQHRPAAQRARENEQAMRRRLQRRAEMAERMIAERHLSDEALIKTVARIHQLSVSDLLCGRQFRTTVDARMDLSLRFRAQGKSLLEIAHITGWHHTTIFNHLRRAEKSPVSVLQPEVYDPNQPDESGIWAI